jgi:hypothetical protein
MKYIGTKKQKQYQLRNNCMCAPDTENYTSVCGYKCRAKWHWGDDYREFIKNKTIWNSLSEEEQMKAKNNELPSR